MAGEPRGYGVTERVSKRLRTPLPKAPVPFMAGGFLISGVFADDATARSSGKTDEVLSGEPQRGERAADEGGSRG
ncbi:MAG: hypothetical protein Q8R13_06350 [bacterium]|nr:hypothetical protein [bacterium]